MSDSLVARSQCVARPLASRHFTEITRSKKSGVLFVLCIIPARRAQSFPGLWGRYDVVLQVAGASVGLLNGRIWATWRHTIVTLLCVSWRTIQAAWRPSPRPSPLSRLRLLCRYHSHRRAYKQFERTIVFAIILIFYLLSLPLSAFPLTSTQATSHNGRPRSPC